MQPKLGISMLVALTALALAGCGEEKKPEAAKAQAEAPSMPTVEIKIGHVAPLTGSIAHLGKDNENGAPIRRGW